MNNRYFPVILIVTTLCCGPSRALASKNSGVDGGRLGRLQRRNEDLSCISIIALDAFRLLQSNSSGIQYHEVDDAIIPYEASSQVVTDESFLCELSSGAFATIGGTHEQYTEMRKMLNNGTLISAESKIKVEVARVPAIVTAEGIPSSSSADDVVVTLPSGGITIIDDTGDASTRRRLGRFNGDKRILLVRVTDIDGRAVPEDAYTISDKFFGTYGDTMTVKSGFAGCSFGNMEITNDYGTTAYDSLLSAPGVLDVTIGLALTSSSQISIVEAAITAAMSKLNVGFPGPFDHVIFILEDCYTSDDECNFAAYGYINHWVLVTLGDNWKYPAVIMHELGHNLNMGHSGGLDGMAYTDHTCLMGNPLFSDDVGKMCFNAVKNFQIAKGFGGWYTADTDIAFFNSGTTGGTSWSGRLIGMSDYGNNLYNHPIILKLETGTGSDYFVSFNRAGGVNSEVQEANDLVLIHRVEGGHGTEYSQSMLMSTLYGGRTGTIENWRKSGIDLTVMVNEINLWSSPAYADVLIKFGETTTTTTTSTTTTTPETTTTTETPTTTSLTTTKTPETTTTTSTTTSTTSTTPETTTTTETPTTTTSTTTKTPETTTTTSTVTSSYHVTFDSGTTSSTSWSGYIAEEGSNFAGSDFPTRVHLYSGSSNTLYLEYKDEQLYFQSKRSTGDVYTMGAIPVGGSELVANWRYSGYDLAIEVGETEYTNEYARVKLVFRPE